MSGTTLRDLSRAYAAGALDRETYRRQRHDLLTKIEAGQTAVHAFQAPEPEQRTVFPYADDEGDTTQEILAPLPSSRAPTTKRGSRAPLLTVVAVVLLGGAAAAYYFLNGGHDSDTIAPPAPSSSTSAAPASDPVSDFLTANQWEGTQLEALGTRWDGLDENARAALRAAPAMRRLTDKSLEQIQAENALITLGDAEESLRTQQQLLDLMDHLGVEDGRLRRARETWRKASADFAHQRVLAAEQKAASATAAPADTAPPPASTPDAASEPAPLAPPVAADTSATAPTPAPASPAAEPVTPTTVTAPAVAASAPAVAPATDKPAVGKPARGTCKASLAKTRRPYCQDALANIGKGPALVVVPAGQFEMGGKADEEQPRHTVTIAKPFAMGLFEVSAGEFAQFCKASGTPCPAQPWSDPSLPVVNVSWAAANAYVEWLSKVSGANYRLPSEAEWEYAARAGTRTPTPFGKDILPTHARYSFKNTETTPLPAADRSVNRNDFKLYHMLGNVREWVADVWTANYAAASNDGSAQRDGDARHVVRGGSYADRATALRSAARLPLAADGDAYTGFRVLRAVE